MKYIDKIRQEIERRKKEHMYNEMPITIGRYYEDRDLLAFIDSLQQEQPSSSDLDEAAEEFAKRQGVELAPFARKFFKDGAKWQKEQMLKDSVEADVNSYIDLAAGKSWAEFVVRMPTKDLGDKVHLIIIKEDKQ